VHAVPITGVTYGLSILAQEREEVGECSPRVGIEGRTGAKVSTARSGGGAQSCSRARYLQDGSRLLIPTIEFCVALRSQGGGQRGWEAPAAKKFRSGVAYRRQVRF